MSTLIILATGYMQPDRISNGMAKGRAAILAAKPDADVRMYSWRDYERIPEIAADIVAASPDRLIMAGHSFGVWFLYLLSERIAVKYEVNTLALLSADGVNRKLGKPLKIHRSVGEVWSWYQTRGVIKGSRIIVTPPTVLHRFEVHCLHPKVDEVAEFQAKLLEFATA